MIPSDQDSRLARVRKLLANAEDTAVTPQEAEAYTAKAAELMASYGIDRAMLAAADPATDVPGDLVVELSAPYARDKADLLWAVASALRCRGVLRSGITPQMGKQLTMHLFGFRSDLERLELLYTSLLVQIANGLAVVRVPFGEHPAAFRRTWIAGFSHAISQRLAQVERQAADAARDSPSTTGRSVDLVLADRADVVARHMREAYPRSRPASGRRLSGGGYAGGYAAGRRADLGGDRLSRRGGSSPALE